jgi:hypothetical protein
MYVNIFHLFAFKATILIYFFIRLLFFNGCIVNIVGDTVSAAAPAAEPIVLKFAALALLAVYEVVVRIVPSVGYYSVV